MQRWVLYAVVGAVVVLYCAFSVYQLVDESKQLENESKQLKESILQKTIELQNILNATREESKILTKNLSAVKEDVFKSENSVDKESVMCASLTDPSSVSTSTLFLNYEDKSEKRFFSEVYIVNTKEQIIGPTWGASWGDYNGDIYPDLLLSNHYENINVKGDHFEDITNSSIGPINPYVSHSACWGDFSGDYWDDILEPGGLKYGYLQDNHLWIRKSDSSSRLFDEASLHKLEHSFVDNLYCFWWDSNLDGELDLFEVGKYQGSSVVTVSLQLPNNQTFVDGAPTLFPDGLHDADFIGYVYLSVSSARRICFVTISAKGRIQIFDGSSIPYVNVTVKFPTLQISLKHRTVVDATFFDLDNNHHIDIILATDVGHPIVLYNEGGQKFTPTSLKLNAESNSKILGITAIAVGDFNNDMLPDLYAVRSSNLTNTANVLYINQGNREFVAHTEGGGAGGSAFGCGDSVAVADFDVDGSLDLLVTNGAGPPPFGVGPTQLFRNTNVDHNNWLEIDLIGVLDNSNAIGAIVAVKAGGVIQTQVVGLNTHTARSSNHRRLHFGLGNATVATTVSIWWTKRHFLQEHSGIAANQLLTIIQLFSPYIPERVLQIAKERGLMKMECEPDMKRMRPKFLILGIWKAGTTSLAGTLGKHPQIKEFGIDWYWNLFPCGAENEITFEATAGYLYQEGVPERIKPHLPDTKFVVMLRDPVERAYSHFYMDFRARIKNESISVPSYFDEQMKEYIKGFNNCTTRNKTELCASDSTWSFLNAGLYYYSLQRWFAHFPQEHFHILSFADFIQPNNTALMHGVLNFLGVEARDLPHEVFNVANKKLDMLASTRTMLYDFYESHNRKLYALLNRNFGWQFA